MINAKEARELSQPQPPSRSEEYYLNQLLTDLEHNIYECAIDKQFELQFDVSPMTTIR